MATGIVLAVAFIAFQQPGLKTSIDSMLSPVGIRRLTATSLEEAIAEGESNRVPVNSPMLLRARRRPLKGEIRVGAADEASIRDLIARGPFSIVIVSPYATAATLVYDAKRRIEPRPRLDLNELNGRLVHVRIGPGQNITTVDDVENVLIKRGESVFRPLMRDPGTSSVQNALGAGRTVRTGDFTFDFGVFEPSMPITIVVVGPNSNFEWTMTKEELSELK
jgi:hypothetical protein